MPQIVLDERRYRWTVDRATVADLAPWAQRQPELFEREVATMARHFPRWLLVATRDGRALGCGRCQAPVVPLAGGPGCLRCGRPVAANGLGWSGLLPAIARLERPFGPARERLRAAGFKEVAVGEVHYLLVPLIALYPAEWPATEPMIRYDPSWLEALGLPTSSAAHHVVHGGRACLYAWRQWQAATMREVLQQRVVNHLASLLKIVAGQSPSVAFLGNGR